jgi:predicted alpha/beta superfamily hydrolase
LILVGIENTQRRRDLTGFTEVMKDKEIAPVVGGSEKFRAFINNELFPEIDKRYRTTKEKSIIGESASGLFVMETFFLTPDMFDCYIAFDPSLWWNNHYLVRTAKEHLAKFPQAQKRIWFAGSDATDIAPFTKELATIFMKENNPNIKWNFSDEPNEKHTTIFRATKEKAIIWTFN